MRRQFRHGIPRGEDTREEDIFDDIMTGVVTARLSQSGGYLELLPEADDRDRRKGLGHDSGRRSAKRLGKRLEFAGPVTGSEIATAIGPGLAKAAIALRVDGTPRDLAAVIDRDAGVAVITRNTPDGIEILRHDAAHVMAEAVKELYPDAQVTFGPATETGFYYDFARDAPFTQGDLDKIEVRMREIVRRDEKITREVWDRDAAIAFFREIGESPRPAISARPSS